MYMPRLEMIMDMIFQIIKIFASVALVTGNRDTFTYKLPVPRIVLKGWVGESTSLMRNVHLPHKLMLGAPISCVIVCLRNFEAHTLALNWQQAVLDA